MGATRVAIPPGRWAPVDTRIDTLEHRRHAAVEAFLTATELYRYAREGDPPDTIVHCVGGARVVRI